MARAFRCDDCEEFFESATAAQLQTTPEDYSDRETWDLCEDCLKGHVAAIERAPNNGTIGEFVEGP